MTAAPLLVELHTEELPPKALRRLGATFAEGIAEGLRAHGLAASSDHRFFATPRRLAVLVDDVLERAPDRDVELKGPSVKVGLGADGSPSQALQKWAERQNVALESLERRGEGKQEHFFAHAATLNERGARFERCCPIAGIDHAHVAHPVGRRRRERQAVHDRVAECHQLVPVGGRGRERLDGDRTAGRERVDS